MPAILREQRHAVLPFLLAAVLLGSLLGFAPRADAATLTQRVDAAVRIVENHQGDPYVYGAAGPHAFDCSGLVYFSYRAAGFTGIPRTAAGQAAAAHRVDRSQMRPGDLVFFSGGGGVYHVGVYVGRQNGRPMMVDAPHPGAPVRREPIWSGSWFAGSLR